MGDSQKNGATEPSPAIEEAPPQAIVTDDEKKFPPSRQPSPSLGGPTTETNEADPMNFGRHRREKVTQRQMKIDHPNGNKKELKQYYLRQNNLIDQFLGANDEERATNEEDARLAPKIKFAVHASFAVNFCLFVIQLYAAISTGSLSVSPPRCNAAVPRHDHDLIPCLAICNCCRCLRKYYMSPQNHVI